MTQPAQQVALVLTTFGVGQAMAVARALVDERLAACVNILPEMESIYRWKGAVETARERQLLMKTSADRVERLRRRIAELHPYDVPELLVLPIADGGEEYLAWIRESTGP